MGGLPRGLVMTGILAWALSGVVASAQDWPSRPVVMVVPFAAGGALDALGRLVAPRLGELLGQQVVVENTAGAGGMTGANRIAKAPPDGYQFLLGHTGTHAYNQTLYRRPAYNSVTEFAPVMLLAESTYALIVRKDFPAENFGEFVAYAKANQSKLQYGSGGVGSNTHISCVMLNIAMGTRVTHIPYRSSGQSIQDLMAGRVDFTCEPLTNAVAQIRNKTVKPIAILSSRRSPVLPDLATTREQGFDEVDVDSWTAFFLPAGTPDPIVRRLNKALSETVDTPAVRQRFESIGQRIAVPERRSPEYLTRLVPKEIERWAAPIKASGVLID
jgi:tripartite-type tricarboxylate transporter receptor subunit TctC